MFSFSRTSTARAALLAAVVALLASQSAHAARPSDPHYQAHAQMASRADDAGEKGVG